MNSIDDPAAVPEGYGEYVHPNDLIPLLRSSFENLRGCARAYPSRELSLAITNAEQALMWLEKAANLTPGAASR